MYLSSSFWLDETITGWLIRQDWTDLFNKSLTYQAQSPFYFLLLKIWSEIFGSSEAALRSFSALLTAATLFVTILIARELKIKSPWLTVGLPFITFENIIISTFSARPYALALFLSTSSFYFLIRWARTLRKDCLIFYLLTLTLTFYAHYLFIAILIPQLIYFLLERKNSLFKPLLLILLIFCLLSIPGLIHMNEWWMKKDNALPSLNLNIKSLANIVMPRQFWIYLPFSFLIGYLITSFKLKLTDRTTFAAIVSWCLTPLFICIALSLISSNSLVSARYFLWGSIGLVLTIATLLSSIERKEAIYIISASWIALSGTFELQRVWRTEDWRDAAQQLENIPQGSKILLYSGLQELESRTFLHNPANLEYLTVPFSYYVPNRQTSPVSSQTTLSDIQKIISDTEPVKKVYFITFKNRHSPQKIIDNYLKNIGFSSIKEKKFGSLLRLFVYSKD